MKNARRKGAKRKFGYIPISMVSLLKICPSDYFREKLGGLFKDYWRDLSQGQPNHIEIVGEKLTITNIINLVAARYCLPMTIGRGYCSTRPKHDIAERYRASGKQRLVLLVISDFDPDGDEIAHSLARSLRDDFGIANIDAIKFALKAEQVAELELPPSMVAAKSTSANYKRFVDRYRSEEVYELEALPPETLQELLDEAIRSVLDVDAFNAEIASEKQDAAHIEAVRRRARGAARTGRTRMSQFDKIGSNRAELSFSSDTSEEFLAGWPPCQVAKSVEIWPQQPCWTP